MEKLTTASEAISRIKDGSTLMIGGFLGGGAPHNLIAELINRDIRNLTVICNDTDFPDKGIGLLITQKRVKKVIVSHIGTNPNTGDQMNKGEIEVEFSPQGTLVERIRSGGAGLGGVLTPTGIGTIVAEGKEIITVEGKEYLLEKPLRAEFALIKAGIGDRMGNLVYHGTARNFNPVIATAADCVIAEVEKMVEPGEIPLDNVHTPAIFVDYIVIN